MCEAAQDIGIHAHPRAAVARIADGREIDAGDAAQGSGIGHDFIRRLFHCRRALFPIIDNLRNRGRREERIQLLPQGVVAFPQGKGHVEGLFPAKGQLHAEPFLVFRRDGNLIADIDVGNSLTDSLNGIRFRSGREDLDIRPLGELDMVVVSVGAGDRKACQVSLGTGLPELVSAAGATDQCAGEAKERQKCSHNPRISVFHLFLFLLQR